MEWHYEQMAVSTQHQQNWGTGEEMLYSSKAIDFFNNNNDKSFQAIYQLEICDVVGPISSLSSQALQTDMAQSLRSIPVAIWN